MGYTHGIQWNEEKITNGIFEVMKALNLDRFPSREEINSIRKDQALHNAIVRNGGYREWANKLTLSIKESETKLGQDYEEVVTNLLKAFGYEVKRMTTKYPYDLLVNDRVRIDVKVGSAYLLRGSRVHTFGISKRYATCDLYVVIALDELKNIERTFLIPSHELQVVSLSIGKNSVYNKYINRWDFIDKYNNFYAQIA